MKIPRIYSRLIDLSDSLYSLEDQDGVTRSNTITDIEQTIYDLCNIEISYALDDGAESVEQLSVKKLTDTLLLVTFVAYIDKDEEVRNERI